MSYRMERLSGGRLISTTLSILFLIAVFGSAEAETGWIKIPPPASRPEGAPKITEVQHSAEWRERAQFGIAAPVPDILKFLENQGNWYTPFTEAGMVGPYDIRNWHGQ